MNIRLDIEYDGSLYAGWQIQKKDRSVQSSIEEALFTILKSRVKLIGAGRTDSGVHARGQVANFKVESLAVGLPELKRSLNGLLKEGITVRKVSAAAEDFHARYSAKSRNYVYSISKGKRSVDRNQYFCLNYDLDMGLVRQAACKLLGRHDFKNLSVATGEKSTLCEIRQLDIEEREREVLITITADRFLHKMVRMVVGLLIDIGRGKAEIGYLDDVLSGKKIKRKQGFAAPPQGLCLMAVEY